MHSPQFVETSASSSSDATPPDCPRYAESFSSLRDIAELFRLTSSQRYGVNAANIRFRHRRVKSGETIYRSGQSFEHLYILRFGSVKIVLRNVEGDERVLSFPMKGNLLGFDGVYDNQYATEAIALTDAELVVIPFKYLAAARYSCRELEHMIYMATSRELTDEHTGVGQSSPLRSNERVARFLEEFAKRQAALGYSSTEFSLPMTRRDIGCYLGLSLETVSRSLSALASMRIISVHRQNLRILRPDLLHRFQSFRLSPVRKRRDGSSLSLTARKVASREQRFHLAEVDQS